MQSLIQYSSVNNRNHFATNMFNYITNSIFQIIRHRKNIFMLLTSIFFRLCNSHVYKKVYVSGKCYAQKKNFLFAYVISRQLHISPPLESTLITLLLIDFRFRRVYRMRCGFFLFREKCTQQTAVVTRWNDVISTVACLSHSLCIESE